MFIGRVAFLVVALTGALLSPSASTQDVSTPLTLPEAIARSLDRNPELKAFGHELEAQAGRIQQAGARPPPEVHMLAENVLGSGARNDFDAAEVTLSLAVSLEHGARERRVAAAQANSELLTSEQRIQRLDVAAETARRFIDVLESQQGLEDARAATALGQKMLESVQRRVAAGQVPRAEEARAYARLARLHLDEEHAEHQLAARRQRLAALWGDLEPQFPHAQGAVLDLPPLEDFALLRARLTRSADLEQMLSEKRLREAEVRLAESRRRLPWQLTTGFRHFEDQDDHAFIVGVIVPIGSRTASEGAIAEARARSAQTYEQTDALRVRLESQLFGIYQELRHSYSEVATLRDEVLPRMTDAAEQSRQAYERGRYAYGEWLAAQRELIDLRRGLLAASAEAHRQQIEIERLTGAAVGGVTP